MNAEEALQVQEDRVDLILRQWARVRPDLELSPMEIIGRLLRAARYLDAELAPVYQPYGLDFGLFDVLATLRRAGEPDGLSPKELNDWCMLTSGAMTARLDRLEKMGLVVRWPDPDDRRGIIVKLSPAGLALIDQIVVAHLENENRLVSSLTASERELLARLLRRLIVPLEVNHQRRGGVAKGSRLDRQ